MLNVHFCGRDAFVNSHANRILYSIIPQKIAFVKFFLIFLAVRFIGGETLGLPSVSLAETGLKSYFPVVSRDFVAHPTQIEGNRHLFGKKDRILPKNAFLSEKFGRINLTKGFLSGFTRLARDEQDLQDYHD